MLRHCVAPSSKRNAGACPVDTPCRLSPGDAQGLPRDLELLVGRDDEDGHGRGIRRDDPDAALTAIVALGIDLDARETECLEGTGADVISFTAGVGENAPAVRAGALETLGFAGVEIDPERNESRERGIRIISTDASAVTVLVVPTDEELEIARQTLSVAQP